MMRRLRPAEANYADRMRPIEELTITFREDSSVPEVILNGVKLNDSEAGLVSVHLNWTTNQCQSIDELSKRKVSIEYFDKPGNDMTLCKISQSFRMRG